MPGESGEHIPTDSLVAIGRYPSPAEAHIVRGRPQAHGLFAVVADDQHASVAWHLTLAIGGVRVMVRTIDRDAALSVLEIEAVDTPPDYDPISVCPACGSDEVMRANSWLSGAVAFLAVAMPLLVRTRRRACHACGHRWLANGESET